MRASRFRDGPPPSRGRRTGAPPPSVPINDRWCNARRERGAGPTPTRRPERREMFVGSCLPPLAQCLRFEFGFRVFRRRLPSSCFGHGSLLPAPLPFPSPRRRLTRAADPNSRVICAGARARLRALRGGANRAPDCPRARGLNAGARLPSVPREFFLRRRRRGRRSGLRMPLLSYTITEFAIVKLHWEMLLIW